MISEKAGASLLALQPHFDDGDEFYATLVDAIEAVGEDKALRFLSRLVLILGNQVGDREALERAVKIARDGLR